MATPTKKSLSTAELLALFRARASPRSITDENSTQNTPEQLIPTTPPGRPPTTPLASSPTVLTDLSQASCVQTQDEASDENFVGDAIAVNRYRTSYALQRPQRSKKHTIPPSTPTKRTKRESLPKHDLLTSDLSEDALNTAKAKPDTLRSRIRYEVSNRTKGKRDAFLLEHRHLFLPLLPPNNYIAKLLTANVNATEYVAYRDIQSQPENVTATLKPYQLSGLSFLVHMYENGTSAVLGDEMGLGKTLQTLSLFQHLEENHPTPEGHRPYLVICPLSVLSSWVSEATKWTPKLRILRFHGPSSLRPQLKLQALGKVDRFGSRNTDGNSTSDTKSDEGIPDVIITTYETFVLEQSWFKTAFAWRYCVLDEGHKIKNIETDVSRALQSLKAERRLLLTGTPLQNNLQELWSLLHWLFPEVFTDRTSDAFKEAFDIGKGRVSTNFMSDARRLLELVMLRRMKDSEGVNLGLPPKEEVLLYVPLTPLQRTWYTRLLTKMGNDALDDLFRDSREKEQQMLGKVPDTGDIHPLNFLESSDHVAMQDKHGPMPKDDREKRAWTKLMNLIMQLRKCCSHPYLVPGAVPEPYYFGDHIRAASGKFIVLGQLIEELIIRRRKKILIFSGFTKTLDWCEDLLTLKGAGDAFGYLRLDGSSVPARRNLAIRMFNDPSSNYKVMLISTKAGGLGLNLASATSVIFMDFDFNPQMDLQAEARAHRIGQTEPVTVYKICTQGTVEEQMLGRIRKKLYLSTKITESMTNVYSPAGQSRKRKRGKSKDVDEEDSGPQLGTSQLMSLIRRGTTTLAHEQIDSEEMSSWTFQTMLDKCRDHTVDETEKISDSAEVEKEWLAKMERVECAVLEGVKYERTPKKGKPAAEHLDRAARRQGKNTTVLFEGHVVSKESMACGNWEAVPTIAGKDARLAEPKRDKAAPIRHQHRCQICWSAGEVVVCVGCPRAYHVECLGPEFQARTEGKMGFRCPQHHCAECERKTADAGGMIFRCRSCEKGFCEDCLDWSRVKVLDETLVEFEKLDYGAKAQAWFVECPMCVDKLEGSGMTARDMEMMMRKYEKAFGAR